jgi:hypothetical protein
MKIIISIKTGQEAQKKKNMPRRVEGMKRSLEENYHL